MLRSNKWNLIITWYHINLYGEYGFTKHSADYALFGVCGNDIRAKARIRLLCFFCGMGIIPLPLGEHFSIFRTWRIARALILHLLWCTKYRYQVLTGQFHLVSGMLMKEICLANYVESIREHEL